jgi:ABC-type phosphate transport system substrate-binding protein
MTTMRNMKAVVLAGLALALGNVAGAPRLEAQTSMPFVVVVHESNPTTTISRDELSRIFLKKITVWRTRRPVTVVDQRESSNVREQFTRTIHHREVSSVASFWQQQIFAGRAVPPAQRTSDADVMTFVANNPDAIGYVSAGAQLVPGVRAVTVQ